jgi:hypothetical protein
VGGLSRASGKGPSALARDGLAKRRSRLDRESESNFRVVGRVGIRHLRRRRISYA